MGPKMDPKSIKNGALGGPRAAKGRLCHPPWSILRGPKNGRFLKGPWGAKKSMDVSPGAAKGRKKRPGGRASARQGGPLWQNGS